MYSVSWLSRPVLRLPRIFLISTSIPQGPWVAGFHKFVFPSPRGLFAASTFICHSGAGRLRIASKTSCDVVFITSVVHKDSSKGSCVIIIKKKKYIIVDALHGGSIGLLLKLPEIREHYFKRKRYTHLQFISSSLLLFCRHTCSRAEDDSVE